MRNKQQVTVIQDETQLRRKERWGQQIDSEILPPYLGVFD